MSLLILGTRSGESLEQMQKDKVTTVSINIVGTICYLLALPMFGELNAITNIERTRRWARSEKTALGEVSQQFLSETVGILSICNLSSLARFIKKYSKAPS